MSTKLFYYFGVCEEFSEYIMPKQKHYAVKKGISPGIYNSWEKCKLQVHRVKGAQYKSFNTKQEAEHYLNGVKTHQYHKNTSTQHQSSQYSNNENEIKVWTDGACKNNGTNKASAGVGVWFAPNDDRNISEPLFGERQTNQRAELMAAIRCVEITNNSLKNHKITKLMVYTDSMYVKKGITEWVHAWKKKQWNVALTNKDLWEKLSLLVDDCELTISWVHVRAHSGIYGNECADKLASDGCL